MHTDPELISLLALGEHAGTEEERSHIATCPECATELAELQRLVTLGRSVAEEGALVEPSRDVWTRIRDELALDPSLEPAVESIIPLLDVRVAAAAGDLTAEARLAPVDDHWALASGAASLSTDGQGRRILQVALHANLPASGLRQAWLIHRDDPALRLSLGILDGLHGLWTVDHSLDLEQYAILDISQQRIGETEHSGQSLVRGELTLVS